MTKTRKPPNPLPLQPRDKTAGDAALAITKAVTSALPLVGGPGAELVALLTPSLEKRRVAWLDELAERLRRLEAERGVDVEDLKEDPAFLDAVMHAARAADRTSSDTKRAALRNAVLNVALSAGPPAEAIRHQVFLRLIEEFNEWHLRILNLFSNPPAELGAAHDEQLRSATALPHVIQALFPEMAGHQEVYGLVWSDLKQAQLVNSDLHGMMSRSGLLARRTTDFGEEFLGFIRSPLAGD